MNYKFQFFFVLFLVNMWSNSSAQIGFGGRNSALNHATSALPNNEWSVYSNPATIPMDKNIISLYYIRYYDISSLSDMALTSSFATKYGVIATGIHSYGFDLYRETDFRISYMFPYQKLKTAIRLTYNHVSFPSPYGNAGAIGIDLGLLFPLTESLSLGADATNLNRPQLGNPAEDLSRILRIGLSYNLYDKGFLLFDIQKDIRFPISPRFGFEYELIDQVVIRAGAGSYPVNTTVGLGLNLANLGINFTAERHQDLGWSPGVDLLYFW